MRLSNLRTPPPSPNTATPRPVANTSTGKSENLDSYYYGVVMRNHPEIRAVCDQLLPVDVQRENTDMGGADAKRREAANHQAREDKGKGKMNSAGPSLQAAVASAARMSTLQKSIFRNRSKPYSRWPACLLQTACSLRGITGQSKQKDGEKMAVLLENYDKAFERPSPYVADLENRAAGVREGWFSVCLSLSLTSLSLYIYMCVCISIPFAKLSHGLSYALSHLAQTVAQPPI